MYIPADQLDLVKSLFIELEKVFSFNLVGFNITDREKYVWGVGQYAAVSGAPLQEGGIIEKSITTGLQLSRDIPKEVYGVRLEAHAIPIMDNNCPIGSLVINLPRFQRIYLAFYDFAPAVANTFPEGSILFITDLDKITASLASEQFDLPSFQTGATINNIAAAIKCIQSNAIESMELDASVYGAPVMIACAPVLDELDKSVGGVFGVVVPKNNSMRLRKVANNLASSLEAISATIQQLSASAVEVCSNEQILNDRVKNINKQTDEISNVLSFIKQIADETKMLGLNAAIEAARAGAAGRGFGVVAEEIRKLSDESKKTVESIRIFLNKIKSEVDITVQGSQANLQASQEQAAATQEITASIEEITSLADELEKMSQRI
jgi:methyl-accepting chemotaxis protein